MGCRQSWVLSETKTSIGFDRSKQNLSPQVFFTSDDYGPTNGPGANFA